MIILARVILSPVVNSLMIAQMKRDKLRGAEDLEAFGHICKQLGSIFFSIVGGLLMYKYQDGTIFFSLTFLTGALLAVAVLVYPQASEGTTTGRRACNLQEFSNKTAMIK